MPELGGDDLPDQGTAGQYRSRGAVAHKKVPRDPPQDRPIGCQSGTDKCEHSHLTNVHEIGVDRRVFADREFGTIDQQRLPPPPYYVASVGATGLLGPRQFQTDSRLITFAELDPC